MWLLWWLFRHKNIMPWEACQRLFGPDQPLCLAGLRDLTLCFACLQREGLE